MSTDRTLLELAAKAAGYTWTWGITDRGGWWHENPDSARRWNPLTDDGDALRLAVKLGMRVYVYPGRGDDFTTVGVDVPGTVFGGSAREYHNGDPGAATRRAIVRAAVILAEAS